MNEIGETKTPNAGEWWVQNDDGTIVFICGADPDGDPVYFDEGGERLHISTLRFFNQEYHHEPLCTGFDWLPVEPAVDPGESYEVLSEGTVLRPGDEVRHLDGTWLPTGHPGECVGSRAGLKNLYRRKIEPVAEVWPKWIIADHWSDTAYLRRDSADEISAYTIDGKKRENKNGKFSHAASNIDSLIANKTWRYVTESEALARVQHPTLDPDDVPLNPVPGKVVATGTVKLLPVQPDDIAAIVAEHTQQVRQLTQRIGDLVQQLKPFEIR